MNDLTKRLEEQATWYSDGHGPLLKEALEKIMRLQEALEKLAQWGEAYPLGIFPEPDLKKVAELLKAGGLTLDAVSANCMRHVTKRVTEIARKALEDPKE